MGPSGLVVLSVLALQLGVSHSAPSGNFFSINDSFLLSYQSWEQRNVLLDQVKSIWSKVLNETWQAFSVEVTFISEQDTPQNVSTPNGPMRHRVSSQVTGWSTVVVPDQEALLKFKAALNTSGEVAIQGIVGSPGAVASTASDTQGSSSSGSDSGNAIKPFQLTDTIILSYTTSAQRDTFLSRVEVFFRNSLNDYQPTNVTLTLLGESDFAAGKAQHVHLIKFRVTGQAMLPVDIPKVKGAVRQTTRDSHLSGITDTDWKMYEMTIGGVEDAGGATALNNEAQASSNAASLNASSVAANSGSLTSVKSASTTPSPVGDVVLSSVTAAAGKAVSGISTSVAPSIVAATTVASTSVAATSGNPVTGSTTSAASSALIVDGDHTIQTTDAAIITYSSSAERDQLLEQIRAKWEAALNQFNVKFTVTVTFVNEEVSGSGHRVVYRITASSPDSIHTAAGKPVTDIVKTVKQTVISTIETIPSVKPLTPEEQTRFDTSSENIDNQVNKPGAFIPARSGGEVLVASASVTPTAVGTPSEVTTTASSSPAVTVVSVPTSVPVTSGIAASDSSTTASISFSSVPITVVPASITTAQPFGLFANLINVQRSDSSQTQSDELDVTDSAELSYTTPQERDDLLQQILNLWINALGPSNIGGLRITFISELRSGSNGAHTVSYSVTGRTANRTITPQHLTETVHTDIGRSRINGVKLATTASRSQIATNAAEGMVADTSAIKELLALAKKYSLDKGTADEWIKQLYVFAHGGDAQVATVKVACNNICVAA